MAHPFLEERMKKAFVAPSIKLESSLAALTLLQVCSNCDIT